MNSTFTPDHTQALEVIWQRHWDPRNPATHDSDYTTHRIIGWLTITDDDGDPWDVRPVALDAHGNPTVFINGDMAGRWKLRPTTQAAPVRHLHRVPDTGTASRREAA